MTPTILFKGRQPVAASARPAAPPSSTRSYNVLLNLVDHGMTIQQAVDAPRISVTTAGNGIAREEGFDPAEIAKLRRAGTRSAARATSAMSTRSLSTCTGRQFGAVDATREGGLIGFENKRNDPHGKKTDFGGN